MVAVKCSHPGCRGAGMKACRCFGPKVVSGPRYVIWPTPHPEKPFTGHEIRPGCLRVVALCESKKLADLLARWSMSIGTIPRARAREASYADFGANNPQQSWGFEGEPPKAVMKDSGTRDGTL